MCLSSVKEVRKSNKETVKGFKVLSFKKGLLITADHEFVLHLDKWNKAKGRFIKDWEGERKYPAGFHIWTTKLAAENWTYVDEDLVVPVIGRNIRVIGVQNNRKVYVCKELFVDSKDLPKSV